jgi:uncharacterized protein (TIGR03083 family)
MDKQAVITDYRAAYSDFRTAIEGLTEEQMTAPFMDDWGVREVLGHVAGWHDQMALGLERMAQGMRPTPEGVDWSDVQGFNMRFAQDVRGSRASDLVHDLDGKVERFVAALQALPDDRFGEGKTGNRMAAAAGSEHFREHAVEIREARAAGKL